MSRWARPAPNFGDAIVALMNSGVQREEIARVMFIEELPDRLIRYYQSGGQPVFPRGDALLSLWEEVMNKEAAFVPMFDWSPPHRAESGGEMILRKRCPCCGQVMRKHILERWTQLQIHGEKFGA